MVLPKKRRSCSQILLAILCLLLAGSLLSCREAEPVIKDGGESESSPLSEPSESENGSLESEPSESESEFGDISTPGASETDPPIQPPSPPQFTEITMTFTGDCTFGRNQKMKYSGSFDDYYDRYGGEYFFENVRSIFEADDITVINLEGSLTVSEDIQDKLWNHKGRPEYVDIMTSSSVEVATMGNNHRLDYGQSGCDETIQVLTEAGITYCYDGVYAIYEVKGVKVGFVSVNEVYDDRKIEIWLKEGYDWLRAQGCAITVACPHWGGNKTPVIEEYQLELGPKLIDMGYDLVVGNHAHVLQAMQVYNDHFIVYSLGNFSYGGNNNPADFDSGLFQVTFTLIDGELLTDLNGNFIPCSLSSIDSRNDFKPTPVSGEEYDRILAKMNSYNRDYFGYELGENGGVMSRTVSGPEFDLEDGVLTLTTDTAKYYYVRQEAETALLDEACLVGQFSTDYSGGSLYWEVYSVEQYPDLSALLLYSHTGNRWVFALVKVE